MLFEEWIWWRLVAFTSWVAKAPPVRWLEARILRLPPYGALAVFALPGILLFPVKLAALWLIGNGHGIAGLGVFVAAKIAGTAVVARLFTVCRPQLMALHWFARLHDWIVYWRDELYARVKAMAFWQAARAFRLRARAFFARFRGRMLKRRWLALRRLRAIRRRGYAVGPTSADPHRNP
jgi:hypothetical protein